MKQFWIEKALGLYLAVTGLYLLGLTAVNLPELIESARSWAFPEDETIWVVGLLLINIIWISARLILGFCLIFNKTVKSWVFYPLLFAVGLSSLMGFLILILIVVIRLKFGRLHSVGC